MHDFSAWFLSHTKWLIKGILIFALGTVFILNIQTTYAASTSVSCDVTELTTAITNANTNGEADTLMLAADCVYNLTASLFIDADTDNTLTINGNRATLSGQNTVRVIYVNGGANLTLNSVIIRDGGASGFDGQGGGIYTKGGTVVINDSTISNNTAVEGGGIFVDEFSLAGSVTLNNSTIIQNSAGSGGGIYVDNGTDTLRNVLNITSSSLLSNQATSGAGGGIYIDNGSNGGGVVTITHSTIANNSATTHGGGIIDLGGGSQLTINTSTIASNTATNDGGGIDVQNTGTINISSSTVARNTSARGGGILNFHGASRVINVKSSIIAENTAPDGKDIWGEIISQNFNFIGSVAGAAISGTTTNNLTGDVKLNAAGLQSNGGPTATIAIQSDSPAVDKGDCTGTDQRGINRPIDFGGIPNAGNGCDIGAFERENTPPVVADDSGYSTIATETLTVAAPGVLANDTDPEGDTLTAILVTSPAHGTLTLNANGSFNYVPDPEQLGTFTFTYKANDGKDDSENTATVTIVVSFPTSVAPNYLVQEGSLTSAPLELTYRWHHQTAANQTRVPGDSYNLFISKGGEVILDASYPAKQICVGLECSITLGDDPLLLNGSYSWRVRSSVGGISSPWSETLSFQVNVARPALPNSFTVDVTTGRPILRIPNDPGAAWYQIYIGNGTFNHLDWYRKNLSDCESNICSILLNAHPENGSYEAYIRAWGPNGLSIGGFDGWGGPVEFNINLSAPNFVLPMTMTVEYANSGHPLLKWSSTPNATWYQLWIGSPPPDFATTHQQWYSAVEMGCDDGGLCTLIPEIDLTNHKSFLWYIQAWGPGGMSTGGTIGGWVEGTQFTVNATGTNTPQPITPTQNKVVDTAAPTFQWDAVENGAWYQVMVRRAQGGTASQTTVHDQWYAAEDLSCKTSSICTLVIPDLYLDDGAYQWSVRAYTPAAVGNATSYQNFTVQRK